MPFSQSVKLVWEVSQIFIKSMFSKDFLYKNRPYVENNGANWSKLGSFL